MQRFETVADGNVTPSGSPKKFPRTQTVEFAPTPRRRGRLGHPIIPENDQERQSLQPYPTEQSEILRITMHQRLTWFYRRIFSESPTVHLGATFNTHAAHLS